MENRNLKLVADLIRLLLEKEQFDQDDTLAQNVGFSDSIEALLSKTKRAFTPHGSEQNMLSERIKTLEAEVKILREQLESQQDMLQMTVTHLQAKQPKDSIAEKVLREYFTPLEKIQKVLPNTWYFKGKGNADTDNSLLHVIERFGILYVFTVHVSNIQLPTSLWTSFGFLLENIASKRFINASQMIERSKQEFQKIMAFAEDTAQATLHISAILIDPNNHEFEYASTGHSAYTLQQGKLNAYSGGAVKASLAEAENQYRLQSATLKKGTFLLLPFHEENPPAQWHEALNNLGDKTPEQQKTLLQEFADSVSAPWDTLHLVGIAF